VQVSVIVTGDKSLDRALATLEPKLQEKGIRKATRAAAKNVLDDVRRRVPKGKTLALQKSLKVRTARRGNGKRFPRHVMGHAVSTREGLFAGRTFYGGFLEFGTKPRKTKSGANRGIVEEVKFLRGSFYDNRTATKEIFRRELKKALRQIALESR